MTTIVQELTTSIPVWSPSVTPLNLAEATADQLDALKVTPSDKGVSDYVLVLAHDVETLRHRSPLYNAIMYARGGLSRAERELGAVAASVVNHCIYCAAVHSSRYNQLAKSEEVVAAIFAGGEDAALAPRDKAIFDYAVKLSKCPPQADDTHIQALLAAGLSREEILDLTLSTALFAWANRLMHTLGEPTAE